MARKPGPTKPTKPTNADVALLIETLRQPGTTETMTLSDGRTITLTTRTLGASR